MKKIIYTTILLIALWGCDSNDIKELGYDDSSAYFSESKMRVEVGKTISIPITVANINGGPAKNVRINVIDSTAAEGDNYNVLSGMDYRFERGWGTEYIVIEAPEKGDDIMKRIFKIEIESTGLARENTRNSMIVEVMNYSRHPLKQLLGDRIFRGPDLLRSNTVIEFPVTIYPDDNDMTTLYLEGMTGGGNWGGVLPDILMTVDTVRKRVTINPQSLGEVRLGTATGTIQIVKPELQPAGNFAYYIDKPVTMSYNNVNNDILFNDWFATGWTSGTYNGYILFIYYGNYENNFHTGIYKQ